MPLITQAAYTFGDLRVCYRAAEDHPDRWGLVIYPAKLEDRVVTPHEWLDSPALRGLPESWGRTRAWEIDPIVHAHIVGDAYAGGFSHGRTLRNSGTTQSLAVRSHTRTESAGKTILRTALASPTGLICSHELIVDRASGVLEIRTTAENSADRLITLEFLSAFSLGGISLFAPDDARGRLRVHRFRSAWSAEGRHEARTIEELNLERSWTGHGVRSERFGQMGSLPVNGWFPMLGIEDTSANVTWLAQLATPGTWHLEVYRRADQLALSGGGADRIAGEWTKTLQPGERCAAPPAFLTVVEGCIDEACDRLLSLHRSTLQPRPTGERTLPIVFNEWCSSWGSPTHEKMIRLADRLAGTGVQYLVIDDGWAERPSTGFQQNGDWRVNRAAFPGGLRATTDAIRARGLIPGIWFEFEVVNPGSDAWSETVHQLHRNGVPLQVGSRRFWDFRDPWVHEFLAERVIGRLRDDRFGYLKIDYNDSIGAGVDGSESPGENLRQHLAGVQRFLARIRTELPELVIENCSSGGHRLEPSMMALTAMSSFSDAHETPDIPLIAANLNRLVCAPQKQIWAVLRASDSLTRIAYSLAATFLGRMCLSGEIESLGDSEWNLVKEAIALQRDVAAIVREGIYRCIRRGGESWQHPTGHQFVTIRVPRTAEMLVVWHRFAEDPTTVELELPSDRAWKRSRSFDDGISRPICDGRALRFQPAAWSGGVAWLTES